MAAIEIKGKKVELDAEGYLVNFEDWTEEVACALADHEGVSKSCPLTPERMDILRFMRDYYRKFQAFPIVRATCERVHQPKECAYQQFMNPIQAWRVAGLPKPTTEVFAMVPDHLMKN
jgi:TusE/DsrC/DsvC family sulfur relay protein